MDDSTVDMPGVDMDACEKDPQGHPLSCPTPEDNYIGLAIGGELPEDAIFIGECISESIS